MASSFHPCSVLLLLGSLGLGGVLTKKKKKKKKMVVEVIPEDMILQILFRVPPISLVIFKSVCKKWYSLISNLDFLQIYHHHPQRLLDNSGLLLLSTVEEPQGKIILPPQNQNQNQNQEQLKLFLDHARTVQKLSSSSSSPPPQLIDSCNGLLLYRTENHPVSGKTTYYYAVHPIIKQSTYEYHVFNPITKQRFQLPITYDYLYDISGNSKAVLLDGMLYVYIYKDKLVCFDVVKDTIRFLLLPPRTMGHHQRNLLYFGECGGRLRLIERYSSTNSYNHHIVTLPFSFDIKELEDVHDHLELRNWTVKYRVNIEMSYKDHIPLVAQIIHIYRNGDAAKKKKKGEEDEDEGEALLFSKVNGGAVISYDLTSNTFGKERNISGFDQSDGLHVFPYTPTLCTFS